MPHDRSPPRPTRASETTHSTVRLALTRKFIGTRESRRVAGVLIVLASRIYLRDLCVLKPIADGVCFADLLLC